MKMGSRSTGGSLSAAAILFGLLFVGAAVETFAFKPKVPALFLFGDSVVDVGNNNYITGYPLLPQANIYPYGETFFGYPTGRWCNGRLIFDFIAEYLGLPYPPAYLAPSSDRYRFTSGANFASAGSGILDTTYLWEGVINLSVQVQNYLKAIEELKRELGEVVVNEIICESLFVFVTGNNDVGEWIGNTTLQQQYPLEQYVPLLVTKLAGDIQRVIDTGAKKIFIGGLGPLGCVPSSLNAINSTGPCLAVLDSVALVLDAALIAYVDGKNNKTKAPNFVLGTTYNYAYNLETNGTSLGFTHGGDACCGAGLDDGLKYPACGRGNYTLCKHVDEYAFWDFIHPTQRAYELIAKTVWYGDKTKAYPINLKQLAGI